MSAMSICVRCLVNVEQRHDLFSDMQLFDWWSCDSKRNDVKEHKKRNLMKAIEESSAARIIVGSAKPSWLCLDSRLHLSLNKQFRSHRKGWSDPCVTVATGPMIGSASVRWF